MFLSDELSSHDISKTIRKRVSVFFIFINSELT